jgi:RsiW-degrading membrane proteinase PrsW (M82 family)
VIGLIAMGLLGLGLTEEPLKAGMLLLAVLMGFELYYSAVEPALAVMALLAAMNFAIALAACYLAVIKSLPARRPHGNAS